MEAFIIMNDPDDQGKQAAENERPEVESFTLRFFGTSAVPAMYIHLEGTKLEIYFSVFDLLLYFLCLITAKCLRL